MTSSISMRSRSERPALFGIVCATMAISQLTSGFDRYLTTQAPALERVAGICLGNVALLCFERDYKACHRSSVARELGRLADLVPVHLEVGDRGSVRKAAGVHPR